MTEVVEHDIAASEPWRPKRGWLTMDTAPQDRTEVTLQIPALELPAFWCADLKTWVLSRPVLLETVKSPTAWEPRRATISSGAISSGQGTE